MPNPLTEVRFEVPFDEIRADHVETGIDMLLSDAQGRVDALAEGDAPVTYETTLGELEDLGVPLGYAMGVVGHLESVATHPDLRQAYNLVRPRVSEFTSRIPLNGGVWRCLRRLEAHSGSAKLSPTKHRFLQKTLDRFRRSGAELDDSGKAELLEINVELAKLTTNFSENVLDATNAFDLRIQDERQLAGLPPSAVGAARESARAKGADGWRFTLQAPSYLAAMTYLDDRSMRETLFRAYSSRAAGGELDNSGNIERILSLRARKARLLGYENFADLVLEDRMARSSARAWQFVDGLRDRTRLVFEKENEELRDYAEGEVAPWDVMYLAEKLRRERYDFDEEDLRPYFPYEGVLRGLFTIVQRLFGITVKRRDGMPVWDERVDTYDVLDGDGTHLGSFYADYFPRENKRGGAWMDSLITGVPHNGGFTPHLALNCGNLTPPAGENPALLTHREVETIFHEFGHLLHHVLSRVEVRSLAGTNVAWDWVELPSQIMENWCWEREALDQFARHYQTGERIPEPLYVRMKRARNFRSANNQMRQIGFATLDLALHTRFEAGAGVDAMGYSKDVLQEHSPVVLPDDYAMLAAFTHLFASPVGYGAGYYSYKWSEMLDADAFTRFASEGIFSERTGREFRKTILEKGDSAPPRDLFRAFMGRDPDPEALLRRLGLST
ncbi:MAG: M3 family metallopeptidase [Bryobacterales bacterium]|nr:M3 family metallopeptidase [Bryobacterales bacterium]